jgi:hypothetical protein
MFTTIITDCKSENARGRQETRFNSLGLGPCSIIGVDSGLSTAATIEASGNLIDVLDASEGGRGVAIVNVAPRGDTEKNYFGDKSPNGSPFCYFFYKKTLVISTIGGYCLSLVKQFKVTNSVNLLDTEKVLDFALKKNLTTKQLNDHITKSQFRSFDFVPRVTKWITNGISVPRKQCPLSAIPDIPSCIWSVDAFGNCKTTISTEDLKLKITNKIKTSLGTFRFCEGLKDICNNETIVYKGSSGLRNAQFLEIATQGTPGSAARKLNLKIGSEVKIM